MLEAVETLPGNKGSETWRTIWVRFSACILMYIYIRIARVQVDSLSVGKKLLGALPLIHAYLRRLGWPQLLEPFIGHAAYRQALDLLVKSVLLKPSALYRIGSWAQDHHPAYRPSQHLSDDALARALDQLFNADRASLLTALMVRAIQVFQIDTRQIHNDSTSVKFSGAYEQQNPKGLQLLHGFSKDHRPDLKQLVYSLSISADGAVPVHYKAYPGNQTDDPTHWETWQVLCRLVGRADFLYVADAKLCVTETLQKIQAQGGRFVTVLPCLRREAKEFAQQAQEDKVQWAPLWNRRALRKGKRQERFELAQGTYRLKEGFQLYWYRSSEKRLRDAQVRQQHVQKALQRLSRLNERRGRCPKTEPAIRRAAERVLAKYQVEKWLGFQIKPRIRYQNRQSTRGKPGAQTRVWKERVVTLVFTAHADPIALGRAALTDGIFPLVTNTDLSPLEVLQKYKYQPRLEKRHCLFKSVLEVSPVFLKKNTRIEALMFIYFVAELIAALLERAIRQNMAARRLDSLPILPESRESKTPSYRQIIEVFENCEKTELYEQNRLSRVFGPALTEIQRLVLRLLEVDASVYA